MDKMKTRDNSLKKIFFVYLTFCFLASLLGSCAIGVGTNGLQQWFRNMHGNVMWPWVYNVDFEQGADVYIEDADTWYQVYGAMISDEQYREMKKYQFQYAIISNTQVILIPLWIYACMTVTGILFCRRELEKPIAILLEASQKISENQLDFKVEYGKPNELGRLCAAFDEMRQALDENNREMWRSMEERKRLNSAFSHDLRTPLTVLRGYNEFLEKYVPGGQVTEEKLMSVLNMMHGQIQRLENYTCKMSAVQKLEDIVPGLSEVSVGALEADLRGNGELICRDKEFDFHFHADVDQICTDVELVAEVYENLLSNGVRYANREVAAEVTVSSQLFVITVTDDGPGFSEQALRLATNPFYCEESEKNDSHFGLGLYLCRVICEKLGGTLKVSNTEKGGRVTASFFSAEV